MWRRGGYGTGLLERFAIFNTPKKVESKDVLYVHAVSVGEVLIASKLIRAVLDKDSARSVVLAVTTSTGHAVAKEKMPASVRVIYSPLDFGFIVRLVFRRFLPCQIVLIEAEAWPNFLRIAQKKSIPVTVVNARLSARSEKRFKQFRCLIKPVFDMVSLFGVQNSEDAERFIGVGVEKQKIRVTGSIKFDPSGGQVPRKRDEFKDLLACFGDADGSQPVILLASTHPGEEKLLASAIRRSSVHCTLVVVPRHAERRTEVVSDLVEAGYHPVLRTSFDRSQAVVTNACLVVDTTGELCDWTAHADWVIIGKSWLGEGGQNPAEAIAAGVPVICGPHMGNFQPLVSQLCDRDGMIMLSESDELVEMIPRLVSGELDTSGMTDRAKLLLKSHSQAIEKTMELL